MTGASVFLERNHLFLRAPDGGVEDVANMVANGFDAIFVNVADYPVERWDFIRDRAAALNIPCGPWARCAEHGTGEFDPSRLLNLIEFAEEWDQPYIVNCEAELKGSGSELTTYIQNMCTGDWALSMEPWPFANVDWTPIKAPVLPQVFGAEWGDQTDEVIAEWRRCGISCVVPTYGTYGGAHPGDYPARETPYGLYTADDCGNNFAAWRATGVRNPCSSSPAPQPPNGGDMQIGHQDGIKASVNRFRTLDPAGTALKPNPDGSWPDISTLPEDLNQWKGYDKLQRTLQILKEDHDGEGSTQMSTTEEPGQGQGQGKPEEDEPGRGQSEEHRQDDEAHEQAPGQNKPEVTPQDEEVQDR